MFAVAGVDRVSVSTGDDYVRPDCGVLQRSAAQASQMTKDISVRKEAVPEHRLSSGRPARITLDRSGVYAWSLGSLVLSYTIQRRPRKPSFQM